jgi:hypothetical protein
MELLLTLEFALELANSRGKQKAAAEATAFPKFMNDGD